MIRRLQPELTKIPGLTLYMQPVQDITVDDRISRTQFQYTLEDPNADELNEWAPKMLARLQQLPELRDVASDQQALGLRAQLVFDRETASRLGITPAMIDQTLYDSYGQRQISTMFTQLNQYHVVLEVKPQFQQNPIDLRDLFIRSGAIDVREQRRRGRWRHRRASPAPSSHTAGQRRSAPAATVSSSSASASSVFGGGASPSAIAYPNGGQVPLNAFTHLEETTAPITVNHQGQFPVVTLSFNLAPTRRSARRSTP